MVPTLIVFGGSGFIGRAFCEKALNRGYNVISISTHGRPTPTQPWMMRMNMTWIACDVLHDSSWKNLIPEAYYFINLIGILHERKDKKYDALIIETNSIISTEASKLQVPYLFLSASFGPSKYIDAKKKAEEYLLNLDIPIKIIRSGLVTDPSYPLKQLQGISLVITSHIPFIKKWAKKVYPTKRDRLVDLMLQVIAEKKPVSSLIDLTK